MHTNQQLTLACNPCGYMRCAAVWAQVQTYKVRTNQLLTLACNPCGYKRRAAAWAQVQTYKVHTEQPSTLNPSMHPL